MFTSQEYLYGWLIYFAGVLIFMLCWWHYSKIIAHNELRRLVRSMAFVCMMVPWYVSEELTLLAPAWIIAGSETVFRGPEAFWRAGLPLLVAMGLALVVAVLIELVIYFRSRGLSST